jgi:hypothetical protein
MRARLALFGPLCSLIYLAITWSAHANAWELLLEDENLSVQQRPYTGSALKEIKGVTHVKASLNALMALLKDAEFNQQWVYRSGGASILNENGYAQAYVYGIVDAPWPMRDRDTVVRFDYQQQAETKSITIAISNFPNFIATKDDFVRVPDFGGYWKLRPEKEGWVEVIYQVYGDPGGLIPVWLANYAAARSVTKTLQNMQSAVKRYENAQSAFVDNASME